MSVHDIPKEIWLVIFNISKSISLNCTCKYLRNNIGEGVLNMIVNDFMSMYKSDIINNYINKTINTRSDKPNQNENFTSQYINIITTTSIIDGGPYEALQYTYKFVITLKIPGGKCSWIYSEDFVRIDYGKYTRNAKYKIGRVENKTSWNKYKFCRFCSKLMKMIIPQQAHFFGHL